MDAHEGQTSCRCSSPPPVLSDKSTIVSDNKFRGGQLFVNSERSKSDEGRLKISGLILIKGYIIGMV